MLLVEDSSTARRIICGVLETLQCRVDSVPDAESALLSLKQRSFDLVIVDRELPDLSGVEIVRAVRSLRGPNRHTPIVALSATVTPSAHAECRAAGIIALLPKPLQRATFERVMHLLRPRPLAVSGAAD